MPSVFERDLSVALPLSAAQLEDGPRRPAPGSSAPGSICGLLLRPHAAFTAKPCPPATATHPGRVSPLLGNEHHEPCKPCEARVSSRRAASEGWVAAQGAQRCLQEQSTDIQAQKASTSSTCCLYSCLRRAVCRPRFCTSASNVSW